uniref:Uncharacterized protein n=1 Tax=Solanum tuberosum TaxID=4113 RepID=M1DJ10_SOLTU
MHWIACISVPTLVPSILYFDPIFETAKTNLANRQVGDDSAHHALVLINWQCELWRARRTYYANHPPVGYGKELKENLVVTSDFESNREYPPAPSFKKNKKICINEPSEVPCQHQTTLFSSMSVSEQPKKLSVGGNIVGATGDVVIDDDYEEGFVGDVDAESSKETDEKEI